MNFVRGPARGQRVRRQSIRSTAEPERRNLPAAFTAGEVWGKRCGDVSGAPCGCQRGASESCKVLRCAAGASEKTGRPCIWFPGGATLWGCTACCPLRSRVSFALTCRGRHCPATRPNTVTTGSISPLDTLQDGSILEGAVMSTPDAQGSRSDGVPGRSPPSRRRPTPRAYTHCLYSHGRVFPILRHDLFGNEF